MNDISNRTLSLFLIVAIVVSMSGTLIILNQSNESNQLTGFATNTSTGQVNLTVTSALSITLTDAIINFGTCDVSGGTYTYVNSNSTNTSYNNSVCTNTSSWGENGDYIELRNDGNTPVNVTVKSSVNSTDFFTDPVQSGVSWYKYWTQNATSNPGCTGTLETTRLVNTASTEYNACTNLTTGSPFPGIILYVEANLTNTVTSTSNTMTLTFTAYEA